MVHPPSAALRFPSATPASTTSPSSGEEAEDDDPEATRPESGTKKTCPQDVENVQAWEDVVTMSGEWEPKLEQTGRCDTQTDQYCCQPVSRPAKPFQKWMKTLHRRVQRQHEMLGYDGSLPLWLQETAGGETHDRGSAHRRLSSSDSSFAFVTAVKSASISVGGFSHLTRSRKTTVRSSRGPRTDRSSKASVTGPRDSEDGVCSEKQATLDSAVLERALRRRHVLEELITTEEGYIRDVRFLMNVCFSPDAI